MEKSLTVTLGSYWNKFLANKLKEGKYSSYSEILREALRDFEEQEQSKLEALRQALIEGEKGELSPLTHEDFEQAKVAGRKMAGLID